MTRFFIALSLVVWSGASFGQSGGAQAEVLFRDGRTLMAAGKYAEACAAFDQSQKLEPATTTLLNLAACREKLGQLATAWGLFLEAERQTRSASDAAGAKLHDVAKSHASALEPRVSKLSINVPDKSRIDNLAITSDGEAIEPVMWNRALPIDGGTHKITAHAPGANEWTTTITIGNEGDTKTVEIPDLRNLPRDLGAAAAPASPKIDTASTKPPEAPTNSEKDEDEADTHGGHSKVMPLVVGGSAVVLIGAGVGALLWGNSTYDQAKAEMNDQKRRDDLYDSANAKRYVAIGLGAAGIATAGVAVWLFFRHDSDEAKVTASRRQVVISPTGISILGTF